MVQNDFAQMVKRELERRGVEVIIAPVLKNNGLKLTGITIKIGQASPTLYLDSVPEEHRNPFMVPRIADEILEKAQEFKGVDAVLDLMGNKEKLLKRIRPRLVNYDWNKEMLTTLSHRRVLDLAVTYAIDIGENAACRVSNELGFTEEDLYTAAMENARNHGYSIRSLSEIVQDAVMLELPIEPLPMLVVTNRSGLYGAYAMLDNEVLKGIGEKFYILPSSIHELIVIPIQNTESVSNLRELVKAVNSSNVPLEKWLSPALGAELVLYRGAVKIKPPFEMGVANLSVKRVSEHIFCHLVSPLNCIGQRECSAMQVFYGGEVEALLDFNLENDVLLNEDLIISECGGEFLHELIGGSFSNISLSDIVIDAVLAVVAFSNIYRSKAHGV